MSLPGLALRVVSLVLLCISGLILIGADTVRELGLGSYYATLALWAHIEVNKGVRCD